MFTYLWLACRFLQSAVRSRCDVALENLVLRQQLVVLTRSSRRPRLTRADRLFWSWLSRAWPRWRSALVIVQPGHRGALAPHRLATVLGLEEPTPRAGSPTPLP